MDLSKLNKRDYPKLQEQKILRVNPQASLEHFARKSDKLADKYKKAVGGGEYKPRIRAENEALPRTGDWRNTTYDPKTYTESKVGLARYS